MSNLAALAAFAARLREPGASFGNMSVATGTGNASDPLQVPYWQPSPLADQFIKMAYDAGWISDNFDWPRWMDSDEAKALLEDPSTIAIASAEQLQKLMTAIIRSDRYCEGAILDASKQGLFNSIVDRAVALG